MVNLRSQKAPARKVIIEESSSEQSAKEEEDVDAHNKKNKKEKVENSKKQTTRGRKKKSSADENEDEEEFKVKYDEDQNNDEDSGQDDEDDEEDSYEDQRKKGLGNKKRQVKHEQSDHDEYDEDFERVDDIKKKGRNKQIASIKQEKAPLKGRKIQVKTEEDYSPSNQDTDVKDDEMDEDNDEEIEEEKIVKKKRGRKPLSEQKNMKKGLSNIGNAKIEDNSQTDINKAKISEGSQIKEKGKRGYKRCKNESCSQLIFIHQKVCPHCSFEHKMSVQTLEKKQKDKKEKSSITFEVLKAFTQSSQGNTKVKIRKKDQLPIQQIKKNALYLDEFNIDQDNLKQMFEEEKIPLFNYEEQKKSSDVDESSIKGSKPSKKLKREDSKLADQPQLKQVVSMDGRYNENCLELQKDSKFDVQVQIKFNDKQEVVDIPQFGHFCVFNQPTTSEQTSTEQQQKESQSKITSFLKSSKQQDKVKGNQGKQSQQQQSSSKQQEQGDWRFFLMNIGYPVSCVGWNYANTTSSEYKDQFLAVGININEISSDSEKIEIYRTMQAYDLLGCHRVGQHYDKESCILIFQIAYDKDTNTFKEPALVKNICVVGTPLTIKWMPKYSTQSSTTFAVLTSEGSIYFYSFSYQTSKFNGLEFLSSKNGKNQSEIPNKNLFLYSEKQKPLMKISISSDVILSCFDWLNNQNCNYVIAGDQVGNIYFIDILGQQQTEFKIAQYYNNAHMGQVLDVKFYPQSNQTDQILFASCGYDGLIKIFDIFDQPFPIFIYESCLKSCKSIAWDIGGKYMLVNRDKQQFSQIILSFFSTSISKKVELNNFAEARQLQKINQDNVVTVNYQYNFLQFKNQLFCMEIIGILYSNENGKIFGNFTEQNRRISVKKIKKKSSESEGFQICNGQFTGQRSQINLQQKRVYNLHLNDVNSFFLSKLSNSEEGGDIKEIDRKDQDIDDEIDEDFEQDNKKSKKQKSKVKIEFQNIENRSYITSLELSQSDIHSLGIKTTEKSDEQSAVSTYNLESFLAFSNLGGVLHISKVYA